MTSTEIGKWLPNVENASPPENIPDRVSCVSGVTGVYLCIPNLCRLAAQRSRAIFAAVLEAAIERAAFATSTGDSPSDPAAIDADVSSSPLGSLIPSNRSAYTGLNPAASSRPPSAKWQETLAAIVAALRYPTAALDQPADGLHIFIPFVLGHYSGNSWTADTQTTVSDLFPEISEATSQPASAAALAKSACEFLARFALVLPLPDGESPGFTTDAYSGKGDDPLVTSVLSYLGLPTAPNNLTPFAYYIGGKSAESDSVPDENWVNILERREAPDNPSFSGLWLPLVRAFADGDETATIANPNASAADANLWDSAVANALNPFLNSDAAGIRFNAFLTAAAALFLSRTAPFGLFILDGDYGSPTKVSRLRAGIAHKSCRVSCSYSLAPVTDETTNQWTGEVTSTYDTELTTWELDSPSTDGTLNWSVSAPNISSSSGYVTERRSVEYDFGPYVAHVLANVSGVDNVKSALAQIGFTFSLSRPHDYPKKWYWSGSGVDNDYMSYDILVFSATSATLVARIADDENLMAEYAVVGDATVKDSVAATGRVSFSATMPSTDPADHANADMSGLRAFPCKGAIASAYTENPLLWSLWAGSLTADSAQHPLYAIPKLPYVLDREAAAETDGRDFINTHLESARTTAEAAVQTRLAASGDYLLTRAAIASFANTLYSNFPDQATVEAAVSKTQGDGGWQQTANDEWCDVLVYLNDDGSVNRVNAVSGPVTEDTYITPTDTSYHRISGSGSKLYTTETRNAASLGLNLADFYPDLPDYKSWNATLKFGGCLAAFDWAWPAISH